jgi:hypothetical protein
MGKIGGDSDLSPRGRKYANELPKLIQKHLGNQPLTVCADISIIIILGLVFIYYSINLSIYRLLNFFLFVAGLDIYNEENNTNRRTTAISKITMEGIR